MKRFFAKSLILLALIPLFAGGGAPKASAIASVSVFETNPAALTAAQSTALATGGTQISTAADLVQKLYEWGKTLLTQTLKKALLDYLVDRVVQYISGNQNGSFVGDWQGYLSGVVATEVQSFGKEFAGVDICAPFSAQLKLAFTIPKPQELSYKIKCTFDEIGANLENFYNDFRDGDWIAYQKSFEPGNNGYGIFLTASYELSNKIQDKKETSLAEAIGGQGFLSKKECTEDPSFQGPDEDGDGLPDTYSSETTPDIDGDGEPGDIASTCFIVTPGAVVGEAVFKAVGSDFDFIVNAQDLSAYTAAITNAVVGRVLSEGLKFIQPSQASTDPNDYPVIRDTLRDNERSDAQRFRSERDRLVKDVKKALSLRQTAKDKIEKSSSSWLKNTNGNSDLAAEAISQLKVARQALMYAHNEIGAVIQKSGNIQYSDSNANFCSPVKTVQRIGNVAMPNLRKQIEAANEAIAILEIAEDDLPDLDPDPLDPCGGDTSFDMTCEDNNDQIAILNNVDLAIIQLTENTPETRETLQDLYYMAGYEITQSAEQFNAGVKGLDEQITAIFNTTSNYADRLKECFTTSTVTPWSNPDLGDDTINKPPRPFPWEGSEVDPADLNEAG